ncbi:MAG TPA: hypothetical protein VM093_03205 [Aeromicrobium sp.]|nr:hypothetical protein [Aeromicrobium sp.]
METPRDMFGRPVTEEEIQELLRERAERLDPANRPSNAEVDNTTRDWDYAQEDFSDMVGRRPKTEHAAHVRPIERPPFLRGLGVALNLV